MEPIQEQKCPACGAPMRFDIATGQLVCDYCGRQVEISPQEEPEAFGEQASSAQQPPEEDILEGFSFDQLTEHTCSPDAARLPVCNCVSCGAEVIVNPEQVAATCPYCGNNIVLTQKISGNLWPDGLIPFRIQPQELPGAVQRYYRDKKLLPRGFFSNAVLGKVTGVYVPFWVFDGGLSGVLTFSAYTNTTHRRGDFEVTTTKHFRLVRQGAMTFHNLPADASAKVDDKLMDSLEPFSMEEEKPFDLRYLAGFTADRFDVPKATVSERAQNRMNTTATNLIQAQSTGGYSSVSRSGGRLSADLTARYLLFPVYLFRVKHGGQKYDFAVNGQTGKVVGKLPIDPVTCRLFFLLRFGLITGGMLLASLVRYLMIGG